MMMRLGGAFLAGSLVLLLINALALGPTYIPGFPQLADRALELLYSVLPASTPEAPLVASRVLDVLYMLLPGFVGGCILRSKGALVGALVGLTGTVITLADVYLLYGNLKHIGILQTVFTEVFPQAIAGLAGVQVMHTGVPPNNSFKPTPLRGAA